MYAAVITDSVSRAPMAPSHLSRLTLIMACALPLIAETIYVNGKLNTAPPPDGRTWVTAFSTVQAGINAAQDGDEVWVAATNYFENIMLKAGVALYGGFTGNEKERDQRNWILHPTILDGRQSNSVVIVEEGATDRTRIDGFTIQNGAAPLGGGIHASNASPVIANNLVFSNRATANWGIARGGGGGGLYCASSSAIITANAFLRNVATNDGLGGATSCVGGFPTITSNLFLSNHAGAAGALALDGCTATVAWNRVIDNEAIYWAGGIEALHSTNLISNNEVRGNRIRPNLGGSGDAGGISCWYSSDRIINNVILGNSAATGGGIRLRHSVRAMVVNNSILWNRAVTGGNVHCIDGDVILANNLIAFGSSGIYGSDNLALQNNVLLRQACVKTRTGSA